MHFEGFWEKKQHNTPKEDKGKVINTKHKLMKQMRKKLIFLKMFFIKSNILYNNLATLDKREHA